MARNYGRKTRYPIDCRALDVMRGLMSYQIALSSTGCLVGCRNSEVHAAVAVALYKERPYQLERAEQQWDVSQVRAVVD